MFPLLLRLEAYPTFRISIRMHRIFRLYASCKPVASRQHSISHASHQIFLYSYSPIEKQSLIIQFAPRTGRCENGLFCHSAPTRFLPPHRRPITAKMNMRNPKKTKFRTRHRTIAPATGPPHPPQDDRTRQDDRHTRPMDKKRTGCLLETFSTVSRRQPAHLEQVRFENQDPFSVFPARKNSSAIAISTADPVSTCSGKRNRIFSGTSMGRMPMAPAGGRNMPVTA